MGHETRKVDEAAYELQQLLISKEYQLRLEEDMYSTTASALDDLLSKFVPAWIQASLPSATYKRGEEFFSRAIKKTREGQRGEFLKKIMDTTENAAALNVFEPVQSVIENLLRASKGGEQIRKLRKVTSGTTYCVFLFRHESLDVLYGPGKSDQ